MERILITGMTGGLANTVARKLTDSYEIIGVDFREYKGRWPYSGKFLRVDYNKRVFSEIFREYDFDRVIHLGRIGNPLEKFYKRYNLNVFGTSNMLDLCSRYKVHNIIIFSTFHIYGAHQYNPTHIDEKQPLRAGQIFHEITDAVELDHLATQYLLQNRDARMVILRPCNIIGPHLNNAMSRLLRNGNIPYLMGFNPMMQFIDEEDISRAIIISLENLETHGVYNIVGPGTIPWRKAIELVGGRAIPVPHYIAYPLVNQLTNLGVGFPAHLMDYFRYSVVMSDDKFRQKTGFQPSLDIQETFQKFCLRKNIF